MPGAHNEKSHNAFHAHAHAHAHSHFTGSLLDLHTDIHGSCICLGHAVSLHLLCLSVKEEASR